MPARAVDPIRVCEQCRTGFDRKRYPSGWLESPTAYAERRFCSQACAVAARRVHRPIVIIESPYAGQVERNMGYLADALRDSIDRGEAPFASHGLYTMALDDNKPTERELGIKLCEPFRAVASKTVFYTDLGWSNGMIAAFKHCDQNSLPAELRSIGGEYTVAPPVAPKGVWGKP